MRWYPHLSAGPAGRAVAAAGALCALLVAACAPLRPAEPRPPALDQVVASLLDSPPLDRAQWGILILDAGTGRALIRHNAHQLFIPASTAKLAVAATALGELGPEFRYATAVYAPRTAIDSVAASVIVVGRGDPTLSARFHPAPFAPLDSLADSLSAAGVRRVAGQVVVDASYFDDVFVPGSWEVGDLDASYAPPVAAFGVEEATVDVRVAPGAAAGDAAAATTLPAPGLVALVSHVTTTAPGTETRIAFSRRIGGDTLAVSGTIAADAPPAIRTVAVPAAADHGARALLAAIEARGIHVEGGARVVYDTAAARALLPDSAAARPVATWRSPPMAEIAAGFMKPSQNWIAEQVVKTLGAERGDAGSWPAGLTVQRRFLVDRAGIDSTAFRFRDGSGLSAQNLLTPDATVALLAFATRQPWGDAFLAALPGANEEDTTLNGRLAGLEGRAAAKTGTITNVNALSGYAVHADGRVLLFSILSNASGRPAAEVRQAMDRIVEAAAGP